MIKHPALRLVAAFVVVGGLIVAPPLNIDEPIAAPQSEALLAQAPEFDVRWQRGQLTLAGHTRSSAHETELLAIAGRAYPGSTLLAEFDPLGAVPPYWTETSGHIVSLLAATESAHATLSEQALIITAVVTDTSDWKLELAALQRLLPAHLTVDSDVITLDTTISPSELCARAFGTFDAGRINFEESSSTFRNSAYPRLERIIALAGSCPYAQIWVTGHTDASGNEDWNKKLSLQRAQAVSDYVVSRGISRDRLQVRGAGSSAPIADNATRYGRSLNRRIEIRWSEDERT